MTFVRKAAGANINITTVKRMAGGVMVNVQTVKRRLAGAWVTVWTAITASLTDKNSLATSNTTVPPRPYYEVNADGKVYTGNAQAGINSHVLHETWIDGVNPASAYQVRATKVTGGTLLSGTLNTWMTCSTTQQWMMEDGTRGNGSGDSITLLIEIRAAASLQVLASCQTVITSTWNSGGVG